MNEDMASSVPPSNAILCNELRCVDELVNKGRQMSAPTKEYQPLLPSSEEEDHVCSGNWRRHAMTGAKNRAASKMRGAAYVMRLWPDQLSSTLYNCWLALFMMVFMFTAMFGVLMTFSTMPNQQLRFGSKLAKLEAKRSHLNGQTLKYNTVYCPIIKNNNFNLSKYANSFAYLRERFPAYKYNVIVLVNDTSETIAHNNNVVAMNTVLDRSRSKNLGNLVKEIELFVSSTDNLAIKVRLLADFMNDSPLKKNWKRLPKALMPLLIQSVAIWQTGGITFDLNALVEKNSDRFKRYIEKVLRDFPKEDKMTHSHETLNYNRRNEITSKPKEISRKSVNNIRDVINNLKNNPSLVMQANLMGEDSKLIGVVARKTKRSVDSSNIDKEKERNQLLKSNHKHASVLNESKIYQKHKPDITKNKSFLPKFLQILFNAGHMNSNKRNLNSTTTKKMDHKVLPKNHVTPLTQKRESLPSKEINWNKQNIDIITFADHKSTSKRIGPKENVNKEKIVKKFLENNSRIHHVQNVSKNGVPQVKTSYEKNPRLFLDMRGEIIATKASCHVFIGHIFSTAQKYPTINSIQKLIDKTLKTFCVVPSNCIGLRLLF